MEAQPMPRQFMRRWMEFTGVATLFAGAMYLNYYAGKYADKAGEMASTSPDIVLSFLPVVDMRFFFVWGFAFFLAFAIIVGIWKEWRRAAYILWMYCLVIAARSFFIVLTPMKMPIDALPLQGEWLYEVFGRYMTFRHDLFFSSHTAFPYLGFLLFRTRWAQWVFLLLSFLLAASVLLCRYHYSIDVAAAYFITYAIYRLEKRYFRARYRGWRRRWVRRD